MVMRRPTILVIGLVAAIVPVAADAQFALSPRGIFGAVTAPLRGMIERLPHPSIHRHRPGRQAAAPNRQDTAEEQPSQLGRTGPLAWPTAYEDALGYTFWPNDFARDYRGHGFGDIVATLVGPLDLPAPVVGAATRRGETTGSADDTAATACDEVKTGESNWPAVRIGETVQLTPAQQMALDKLQAATAEALKSIKAGCHESTTLAPRQRLAAMVQRLWAVQNAGIRIRAPLAAFYDTLTDDQKAKFNAPRQEPPRGNDSKAAGAAMGRQYAACAAQGSDDADRLIKRISQSVRPTPDQRASLEALGKKSGDMAKLLMASCAEPIPDTPPARLDSVNARLTSINFAATTIQVALNDFYAGLNKDQQARFDALGR